MRVDRLTDAIVANIASGERDFVVWDGELKGFGCRVRVSGSKTYIAQFDIGGRNGKTYKRTLGSVSRLHCEHARILAKNAWLELSRKV